MKTIEELESEVTCLQSECPRHNRTEGEGMNLVDDKTKEEYREAAHYWQQQWSIADKQKQILLARITELENENQKFLRWTESGNYNTVGSRSGRIKCAESSGWNNSQGSFGVLAPRVENNTGRWTKWVSYFCRLFKIGTKQS